MSVDPSHPNAKFLNDMAEAEKNVEAFLADGDFSHLVKDEPKTYEQGVEDERNRIVELLHRERDSYSDRARARVLAVAIRKIIARPEDEEDQS